MFNLSAGNKCETGKTEAKNQDAAKVMEGLSQNMINCPAILTGMSREMRTQMNVIVAFAFLLNNKENNEEEKKGYCDQIYDSCEQIISLFDNFIDSAIIETGSSGSEPKPCNPDKTFIELFLEFRHILEQDRYREILLVTENQSFNEAEYLIDINRVTRVIRNLFQNAITNTKSGYIKAGYYSREDKLTFYILDSGQGYLKSMEFLQTRDIAESLSKFNDPIAAVNLTLTRKLIEIMGGTLWIECNGLTGSGIYFSVPATIAEPKGPKIKYSKPMITI